MHGGLMPLAAVLSVAMIAVATPVIQVGPAGHVGSAAAAAPAGDDRPDMVLVLMDDFSLELLATMPQARRMQVEAATYDNAFVIDSLCCSSRAAMLTGQTPHQTGVRTNTPNDPVNPIGGYEAFEKYGNAERQFSVALQDSGYSTGFIGKFMNGYEPTTVDGVGQPPPKVPGWTDWQAILGGGYNGWGFRSTYLDENGDVAMVQHRKPSLTEPVEERDRHYATNVAADKAVAFIEEHEQDQAPYFLEVATYGPHSQLAPAYPDLNSNFPPAFADQTTPDDPVGGNCGVSSCADLTLDDLVGYGDPRDDNAPTYLRPDATTEPAPAWRTNEIRLTDDQALNRYRDRARMVQSIDRLIARVRAAAGEDAYIFLTADNGFHLGQHQLNGGKGTPYDSDTRVPLIVVGPDVAAGPRDQYVNNIDLAPTFEELAGLRSPTYRSGRSFADTLTGQHVPGARYVFFEHTYAKSQPGEVDTDEGSGGTIDLIPSYIGVRGDRGLLVRFDLDPDWEDTDYAWELYTYGVPWEDRNVFAEHHDEDWVVDLMRRIKLYDDCDPAECRAAAQ